MHELALSEGGGAEGLRDIGLLEGALARVRHLSALLRAEPTIAQLAASYAWGVIRDHPFIDGNKRTAFLVATAFCEANGYRFQAPEGEPAVIFEAAAAGEIQEDGLARWFGRHLREM